MSCTFYPGFDGHPHIEKRWGDSSGARHPSLLPGDPLSPSLCSFSDLLLAEGSFGPDIFYPGRSLGFLPAPPLAWSWGGGSGTSWFHSKRKSLHCPGARSQAGGGGGGDRGKELSECLILIINWNIYNICLQVFGFFVHS